MGYDETGMGGVVATEEQHLHTQSTVAHTEHRSGDKTALQ